MLCIGQETTVLPEHKQLSTNQTLYAFYEKDSQDGTDSVGLESSLNKATTDRIHSTGGKKLAPVETAEVAYREYQLIGREKERSEIIKLISGKSSQQREVISVCGIGGLGKTTLVKDVYQSQELSAMFEKRACATIKHPFNLEDLISSLAMQLDEMSYRNEEVTEQNWELNHHWLAL